MFTTRRKPTVARLRLKWFVVTSVLLAFGLALQKIAAAQAQQPAPLPTAGGVSATGGKFRLIRSVVGAKGSSQGGRFIMEEPRTVFYVPSDRKAVVYFEWEGPPGQHHLDGIWKEFEGKTPGLSALAD
ncbi:MAG: hypothetical protein LAP13_15700 [Acidobacteriia bacterium]|nr:hypothetical protein [Terriglobia bacterium]